MGDNRPPVYWDQVDGAEALVIRASALGHECMWELIACGQGHEPQPYPDKLLAAFDESTEWEEPIIEELKRRGWESLGLEQTEGELYCGEVGRGKKKVPVFVRYHPDFPARAPDGREWLVEVKAFSEQLYRKAERDGVASTFSEYQWQLAVMASGMALPGLWCVGDKSSEQLSPRLFQETPTSLPSLSAVLQRAQRIGKGVIGPDIVQSGKKCKSEDYWPCLFGHLRPEVERITPVSITQSETFNALIADYKEAKQEVEEHQAIVDKSKADYLEQFGREKRMGSDRYVVTRCDGKHTYYDMAQLRRDLEPLGIELEDYKKESKYAYLRVKERWSEG